MRALISYRIPAVLLGVLLCTVMVWALPSADEASARPDGRPADCACRYCTGDGCRCADGVCRQFVACPAPAVVRENAPVCRAHHRANCADCFLLPADAPAIRNTAEGVREERTAAENRPMRYYHHGRHHAARYCDYGRQAPCCVVDEGCAPAGEHCAAPVRSVRAGRHCCGAR
ncbi:MAG: hypothetical protein ACOYJE_04535 [Bacteroidaceae bacterium]